MKKAIFLDRDGTLIQQVDLLTEVSRIKLLPKVARAIKGFKKLGFLTIVITNQPVIARGLIDPRGIDEMHKVLSTRLCRHGAKISAFYVCPHHPEANVLKYRKQCNCRKPRPGLIKRALREFNIDPKKSFMIGDALIDVAAGKSAGLTTILVKTGPGHERLDRGCKVVPDYTVNDLAEALTKIKRV